jgi:hypothetical protein
MMVAVHTPDMSFYFNETTKAKVVPPYAMEVLGGEEYSSYSFLTSALNGVSGQRHAPYRALAPGKGATVPIGYEVGWAAEPVWTKKLEEKSFCLRQGLNPGRPV